MKGEESESVENTGEKFRLPSLFCHSVVRAIILITKLKVVTLIHTFYCLKNQVNGSSTSEGMIIFNIAVS